MSIFVAVLKLVCGSGTPPGPVNADLVTRAIRLVSGPWLPPQTFGHRHTFCSSHSNVGLAALTLSFQLALGDMVEIYLAEQRLAVRWCVLPRVIDNAAFYVLYSYDTVLTCMLLIGPLRLRSEHITPSQGL